MADQKIIRTSNGAMAQDGAVLPTSHLSASMPRVQPTRRPQVETPRQPGTPAPSVTLKGDATPPRG